MTEVVAEKRCFLCKQIKPSSEFYRRRTSRDGLTSECKVCKRARERQYHLIKTKKNVLDQSDRRLRRPLPESAREAGWKLRRDVERLERIFADDRFPPNKQQVALHLESHLLYAAEVLPDLLSRIRTHIGG